MFKEGIIALIVLTISFFEHSILRRIVRLTLIIYLLSTRLVPNFCVPTANAMRSLHFLIQRGSINLLISVLIVMDRVVLCPVDVQG